MASDIKTAVLLLTAPPPGSAGSEGPYIKVEGRECLLRSAELFVNRDEVSQILTAFTKDEAEDARRRFGGHLSFSGVKIGEPADAWDAQIGALVPRLADEITHVLVHDAARPAIAFTDLDALFSSARDDPELVHALAAELEGGLMETDNKGRAMGYRPAEAFRLLLWPRLYPRSDVAALARGEEPPAQRLKLVSGLGNNIRCNRAADAKRVAAMIKLLPEPRREGPLSPFEEAKW